LYRLKLIDKSGGFTYSNIVNLRMHWKEHILIAGNPFKNDLRVVLSARNEETVALSLYDAAGKLMKQKQFLVSRGSNTLNLDNLQNLAAGLYTLEIRMKETRYVRSVLKNSSDKGNR
jgi:Secretion system C-terminal sorting domain